jgi:hypothetical protein
MDKRNGAKRQKGFRGAGWILANLASDRCWRGTVGKRRTALHLQSRPFAGRLLARLFCVDVFLKSKTSKSKNE